MASGLQTEMICEVGESDGSSSSH